MQVNTVSALDQARRQVLCAAFGAIAAGLLSSAPSLYSMLIFERALPSASLDTLIVFGLVLLMLIIAQVAISWAGQEYLTHTWRMISVPSRGPPLLLQRIDNTVSSGLAWAALSLVPTPTLLVLSYFIHPLVAVAILIVLGSHLIATKLRLHLFPKIIGAIISPLFLTLAVGLAIVGSISPGACIAATFLGSAIVTPAKEVVRNWSSLMRSLDALEQLRQGGHLRTIDRSHQTEAHGFARMVAGGVTGTLAFLGLAVFIPAPSVTVLQGRVSNISSTHIKAPATTRIALMAVREGDAVEAGQLLVRFDDEELVAKRSLLRTQISVEEADIEAAQGDPGRVYERRMSVLRLRERLLEIDLALTAVAIVSPAAGIVQEVRSTLTGAPVMAGDHLMTIIPNDDRIVVARLRPQDRFRVAEGALAEVRMKTSMSRYGETTRARVRSVSPDRYDDGDLRVFLVTDSPMVTGVEVEIILKGQAQTVAGWASGIVEGALRRAIR
jgi:multidrug efflux pump subunit AcrA (membrane-fusion protein)